MALDDGDDVSGLPVNVGLSFPNPFSMLFGGGRRRRGNRGGYGYPGSFAQPNPYAYPAAPPRQFRPVMPDIPGVPERQQSLQPAAWPMYSFALATGTNSITQSMNPQAPLRGKRLVFTIIRNGASALLTEPLITILQVGMVPIILTPDGIAASNYSNTATDTNLLLPATQPGVLYSLTMKLPVALAGTDTILVFPSVQGTSIS